MGKTLFDISIDKADIKKEHLKVLKEKGIASIGELCQTSQKELNRLGFYTNQITAIKKKAYVVGEREGFGWKDVEKKHGKLVMRSVANQMIGLRQSTFKQLIDSGTFDDFLLYVGKDILPPYDAPNKGGAGIKYAFILNGIEAFNDKYKTIPYIAEQMGITYATLAVYSKAGLMDEAKVAKGKWDKEWIQKNFYKIKEQRYEALGKVVDYSEIVPKHLQQLIDSYLNYRKQFKVVYGSIQYPKFKKDDAHLEHQRQLQRFMYKMICNRAGIENYWEVEGNRFRELTEDEYKRYFQEAKNFQFKDLNSEDILAICQGLESMSRYNLKKYIRGLFYYVLMTEKNEIKKEEKRLRTIQSEERAFLDIWAEDIEEAFEKFMSIEGAVPQTSRTSLFLTRLQIAKMINRVFENSNNRLRDPQKCAAMLALMFLGCVRPIETLKLEIDKHFEIDPETGLIKLFESNGKKYGIMNISRDISKQQGSPSGPLGTLLVPKVVSYLNIYLEKLYKKYPETRGKGFLFRPLNLEKNPNRRYKSSGSLVSWMSSHKDLFEGILSGEEINHFSSYDTRHTGNNIIAKVTHVSHPILNKYLEDTAEYHSRHKNKNTTNKKYYQEGLTLTRYLKILTAALDFPFDEAELDNWEAKMMGNSEEETKPNKVVSDQAKNDHKQTILDDATNEVIVEIETQITALTEDMNQLSKATNMSISERNAKHGELERKINQLKAQKERILLEVAQ